MLKVTVEDRGEAVILRCLGRIVLGDERTLLCAAVHEHGRNVILDLGGVDAIDAAGIGALISLQAAGTYLKLMNPTEPLREVLRVTRMDSLFEICDAQSFGAAIAESITGEKSSGIVRAAV